MEAKFPYQPWKITELGFSAKDLREGSATGADTIQGSFLNGVFDSEPIVYGEKAYGYAKNHETICNVMDAKSLALFADGERLDMGLSDVRDHRRVLDMRAGVLCRGFTWHTKGGAVLEVEMIRLVSFTRQELAAARLDVKCLEGACTLAAESAVAPAVIAEGDPNDPRNAAGKDRSLLSGRVFAGGALIAMEQKTKNSGFTICCAVEHRGAEGRSEKCENAALWKAETRLQAGESFRLDKSICYMAARFDEEPKLWEKTLDGCKAAPNFDTLLMEQRASLDAFWNGAGLSIEGDDALLQGLRFNLFHIYQSAGRDGKRNIAAKGLTGEGYEGHTFWDTEAYILPVFIHISFSPRWSTMTPSRYMSKK